MNCSPPETHNPNSESHVVKHEPYAHIYDELLDKLGPGTWSVIVGKTKHFVEVQGFSRGQENLIFVKLEPKSSPILVHSQSPTLDRSSKEYEATILESLKDKKLIKPANLLVGIESFLGRPLHVRVFNTLSKEIASRNLGNLCILSKSADGSRLALNVGPEGEEFLSVSLHETDATILGKCLCGVRSERTPGE